MRVVAWRVIALAIVSAALSSAQTSSPEELYKTAVSADDRGDTEQAINLYQQFVKMRPRSIEARTNLGVALVHVGRYQEGISQYQEALKSSPGNPTIQLDLALAWYKQADFEKAAKLFAITNADGRD